MNGFDAAPDLTPNGAAVAWPHPAEIYPSAPLARILQAPPAKPFFEPVDVALEVKIDECQGGYVSKSLDARRKRLTRTQAIALKALTCSLSAQRARTADGRIVDCGSDALRWILDRVAEQLPAELLEQMRAASR